MDVMARMMAVRVRSAIASAVSPQIGAYHLFVDDARLPHGDSFQHAQSTLNWPETRVMAGLTYRF